MGQKGGRFARRRCHGMPAAMLQNPHRRQCDDIFSAPPQGSKDFADAPALNVHNVTAAQSLPFADAALTFLSVWAYGITPWTLPSGWRGASRASQKGIPRTG